MILVYRSITYMRNSQGFLALGYLRPVLEYGCVVWHHGLTVAQSQKLESLQKRALRIIHQIVYDWPYMIRRVHM